MQAKPEQCDFLCRDICIPSRPPDLDCSYIQTRIERCPPDPHRFDREGMAWDVNRNYYIKKRKVL